MDLSQALNIRPGITAVIGGGGKTTFLRVLGGELSGAGHTVLLCTTTKFYPFPGLVNLCSPSERAVSQALRAGRIAVVGTPVPETGKWSAPELSMDCLTELADYVLVEADGSAGRPFKAHAAHEPVIPVRTDQTVLVVGACGFGQPIVQAAHRPELYASLAGASAADPVTPEAAAAVLLAEHLHNRVYINQADTAQHLSAAQILKGLLPCPTVIGALEQEGGHVLCW